MGNFHPFYFYIIFYTIFTLFFTRFWQYFLHDFYNFFKEQFTTDRVLMYVVNNLLFFFFSFYAGDFCYTCLVRGVFSSSLRILVWIYQWKWGTFSCGICACVYVAVILWQEQCWASTGDYWPNSCLQRISLPVQVKQVWEVLIIDNFFTFINSIFLSHQK